MLFPWRRKKTERIAADGPPNSGPGSKQTVTTDEAWERLNTLITNHPLFRLVTFDGLYWIDPFSGALVSAPFDLEETVRDHFRKHEHWRQGKTRSAIQLYAQRWLRWLEEDGTRDPRLFLFTKAGAWYNPQARRPCPHIDRSMAERAAHFIKRIAYELAQDPQASPYSFPKLEELEIDLGLRQAPPPPPETAGHSSGIRTVEPTATFHPNKPHPSVPITVTVRAEVPTGDNSNEETVTISADELGFSVANLKAALDDIPPATRSALRARVSGDTSSAKRVSVSPTSSPQPAATSTRRTTAQDLVAAAIRDLQSVHHLSDHAVEKRLADHFGTELGTQADSSTLLRAVETLREALDREAAQRSGPSNSEIYNCLISMREEKGSAEAHTSRRFPGPPPPMVYQSQLSPEVIEQLVSGLRSVTLVAERLEARMPSAPASDPSIGDPEHGSDSSRYDSDTATALSADGALQAKDADQVTVRGDTPGTGITRGDTETHSDSDADSDDDDSLVESDLTDAEKARQAADDDLADDLAKAQGIQGHLLGGIPALSGVSLALAYQPYSHIGGDFYQVVRLSDERFFFIVGDVSGHGVQAALIVSSIVNSLKIILRRGSELGLVDIMCDLNDYMRECLPAGKFFTAFAGIINTNDDNGATLECVCAGHHPTICLNRSPGVQEPIREVGRMGMGVGIVRSEMFRKQAKSETYRLETGDVLAIYTDGITETMDDNGEELGEVLVRCSFFSHLDLEPSDMITAVLNDIDQESDGVLNDDLTVLVIKIA